MLRKTGWTGSLLDLCHWLVNLNEVILFSKRTVGEDVKAGRSKNSRPVLFTQRVPGQSKLDIETLSQNQPNNQNKSGRDFYVLTDFDKVLSCHTSHTNTHTHCYPHSCVTPSAVLITDVITEHFPDLKHRSITGFPCLD